MRKIILVVLSIVIMTSAAMAESSQRYPVSADDAYTALLASITSLKGTVSETQSTGGYTLFTTPEGARFFVVIADNGDNTSTLKVIKANSKPTTIDVKSELYKLMDENIKKTPEKAAE